MAFLEGALRLSNPTAPRGHRLPIDFFFRSLALDQHEKAICVVLSGTGSDGTQGIRAIKGEGGLVMVQDPDSTEYDGMPRSAIGTGLVDYILTPGKMAEKLISYVSHSSRKLEGDMLNTDERRVLSMRKIFALIRSQTGHDFSQYKPSTITRRIERRMAVLQVKSVGEYVAYIQHLPAEVGILFRDLLIGVTSFFRDPEPFAIFAEMGLPKIFEGRPLGSVIRIWIPGCSTGEEAYSLAILFQEYIESLRQSFSLQIFATDIDAQAIATARAGYYPAGIAADVSEERLSRFFIAEPDGSGFQIRKSIRDILVFSEQDLARDPPFSKLDFISCRNLLIYMGGGLAEKDLLHLSLCPETSGHPLSGYLRNNRRLRGQVLRSEPKGEALSAYRVFPPR